MEWIIPVITVVVGFLLTKFNRVSSPMLLLLSGAEMAGVIIAVNVHNDLAFVLCMINIITLPVITYFVISRRMKLDLHYNPDNPRNNDIINEADEERKKVEKADREKRKKLTLRERLSEQPDVKSNKLF